MIVPALAIAALGAVVSAHSDHHQMPMAGPHQGLWYNTLPGDGGKQVNESRREVFVGGARELTGAGGLCLLGHLDVWTTPVLPVSGERG